MREKKKEQKKVYIGVDVSKDSLDVAIHGVKNLMHVSNDGTGVRKVVRLAVKRNAVTVCFEATGGYEVKLWMALTEAGLNPAPSNPRMVRHFAQSAGKLAKTDAIDAHIIADYAYAMNPRIMPFPETAELKEIASRHCQIQEMLTAEKSRLHSTRNDCIKEQIRAHIRWLEEELDKTDKDLKAGIKACPEWQQKDKLLQSVPGVGNGLSTCLIARLPELGFLDRQKIAALVGVAPLNRDSGKFHGKRRIWGGRSRVRAALYMAALSAIRCNPTIRPLYLRLLEKGKSKKTAITACMRKLITILNAIMRDHICWHAANQPVSATVA